MQKKKLPWREPVVKSIDQCQPIFGACRIGNTEDPNDPSLQCSGGNGATVDGVCARGNGAKDSCARGNGVL